MPTRPTIGTRRIRPRTHRSRLMSGGWSISILQRIADLRSDVAPSPRDVPEAIIEQHPFRSRSPTYPIAKVGLALVKKIGPLVRLRNAATVLHFDDVGDVFDRNTGWFQRGLIFDFATELDDSV